MVNAKSDIRYTPNRFQVIRAKKSSEEKIIGSFRKITTFA